MWHRRVAAAAVVLLAPHVALVGTPPDPYETVLGHALGDIALVGILVVTVWAFAPKLRAARSPGSDPGACAHQLRTLVDCAPPGRPLRCGRGRARCDCRSRSPPLDATARPLPRGGLGWRRGLPVPRAIARYVIRIYDYTV